MMQYTVIFPTGKVMTFYIRSVAEMYASNGRGTLITPELLTVLKRMSNV